MLEKTLESPLDCKEIQPVHSEGDQPWDFFERNDAKAETSVLWPPHARSWLIGKDCDAGRDWGQEEKGTPEDEMAGWHHWLNGRESGTGRPGVLRFMGSQRVGHNWATDLNLNLTFPKRHITSKLNSYFPNYSKEAHKYNLLLISHWVCFFFSFLINFYWSIVALQCCA